MLESFFFLSEWLQSLYLNFSRQFHSKLNSSSTVTTKWWHTQITATQKFVVRKLFVHKHFVYAMFDNIKMLGSMFFFTICEWMRLKKTNKSTSMLINVTKRPLTKKTIFQRKNVFRIYSSECFRQQFIIVFSFNCSFVLSYSIFNNCLFFRPKFQYMLTIFLWLLTLMLYWSHLNNT